MDLTLDELAERSGMSPRRIRFYQSEKLLPPPRREGRVAIYGEGHLERLRVVAELHARGLRLSAIRELVGRLGSDDVETTGWGDFLQRLSTPWSEDTPTTMSRAELQERLGPDSPVGVDELARTVLLMPAPFGAGTYLVPSPGLLDLTVRLVREGVGLEMALEAGVIVRRRLGQAADELVRRFADRIGTGFGRSSSPQEVERALGALRPLGAEAVRLIFAQEMQRALGELTGERARPTRSRRAAKT